VNESFFKFPSTPHLSVLGDINIRNDKVMTDEQRNEFLKNGIIVEEKVDGANLGISFDPSGELLVQNRGAVLQAPFTGQWKILPDWLAVKVDALFDALEDRYILFGEWCYAKHAISYIGLPDWFLGFDVYDKKMDRFFSSPRRNDVLRRAGIRSVPVLGKGRFPIETLKAFLAESSFGPVRAEGIYLRIEDDNWLIQRAKMVRPQFVQAIGEHWSKRMIEPNRLDLSAAE
jgi:ATP-dependent RNA circularization protein (DNA/RNA ligase family)